MYCSGACGCQAFNSNKWTLSVSLHLVYEAGRGVWAAVPAGIRGRERAASSLFLLSNKFITLSNVKKPETFTLRYSQKRKVSKKICFLCPSGLCIVTVYVGHLFICGGWLFISSTQTCEVEH